MDVHREVLNVDFPSSSTKVSHELTRVLSRVEKVFNSLLRSCLDVILKSTRAKQRA